MDPLSAQVLSSWLGSVEPSLIAAVGLLLAARLVPLLILTPWLSVAGTGWAAVLAVAVSLWVALLPIAVRAAAPTMPIGFALGLSVVREVVLGATFAVVANLPLLSIRWAGALATAASGDRSTYDHADAPFSALYRWFGLALFVTLGGAEYALGTIADGLLRAPLGGVLALSGARDVALKFASLCTSAVTLGLVLAMPVLLGVLLLDVTQLLVARWLPRWPSAQLWFPVKHVAVVALAMLSLSLIASRLPDIYTASIDQARSVVMGLTP